MLTARPPLGSAGSASVVGPAVVAPAGSVLGGVPPIRPATSM